MIDRKNSDDGLSSDEMYNKRFHDMQKNIEEGTNNLKDQKFPRNRDEGHDRDFHISFEIECFIYIA